MITSLCRENTRKLKLSGNVLTSLVGSLDGRLFSSIIWRFTLPAQLQGESCCAAVLMLHWHGSRSWCAAKDFFVPMCDTSSPQVFRSHFFLQISAARRLWDMHAHLQHT